MYTLCLCSYYMHIFSCRNFMFLKLICNISGKLTKLTRLKNTRVRFDMSVKTCFAKFKNSFDTVQYMTNDLFQVFICHVREYIEIMHLDQCSVKLKSFNLVNHIITPTKKQRE